MIVVGDNFGLARWARVTFFVTLRCVKLRDSPKCLSLRVMTATTGKVHHRGAKDCFDRHAMGLRELAREVPRSQGRDEGLRVLHVRRMGKTTTP